MNKQVVPKESGLENGLRLLREGYMYISNRRKSYQSSLFETTLLGEKAVCFGGSEASELFLNEDYFSRKNAMPSFVNKTLLGEGGVQGLDGDEHRNRKAAFLSLMVKDGINQWARMLERNLAEVTEEWMEKGSIQLYKETQKLLAKTVCEWAGVPLKKEEIEERTEQLILMIESPAALSPKHLKGRKARKDGEKWISGLVKQVRNNEIHPPEHSALYVFSWHRTLKDELLDTKTAAVEVLNILRPSVAISIYLCFTVLALHQFPKVKEDIGPNNSAYMHMFVQEVRRYFPFFPLQAARVQKNFTWNGYLFEKGTLTLLDIYGTNHDPHVWENPEIFNPNRFKTWSESPTNQKQYKLIAQGGGSYTRGHRCPGEWNTVKAMEVFANHFANKITFDLPQQDLSYSMVDMPTIPKSGVVINNIQWKESIDRHE